MSKEIRIGILAVVAIAAAVWGYKFLLGQNILSRQQIFKARFDNVDQLRPSNAVMVKGFQVGTVLEIIPDPDDVTKLLAIFEVDTRYKIPKNATVSIINESLMGTKAMRIDLEELCTGENCAKSGDYLEGKTLSLLSSLVKEGELKRYASEISEGLNIILDTLESKIQDPESRDAVSESVRGLQNTMINLASATETLDQMLNSSSSEFVRLISNLERITRVMAENSGHIESILANTADITSQVKEADLGQNVSTFMDSTQILLGRLEETLKTADRTFVMLGDFMQRMNEGEGTLGKLARDEDLYINMEKTMKNLDLLLQDFRLNPKRYIDFKIFGSKKQREYMLPEDDPAFQIDSIRN